MPKPKFKVVEDDRDKPLSTEAQKVMALETALAGLQVVSLVYLPDGAILRLQTATNGQKMPELRALKAALGNATGVVDNAIDALFRSIEEAAKAAQGESRATES